MAYDTIIKGGMAVLPGHGTQEADLAIRGERIAAILQPGASVEARETIDASGHYILPGALDTHTHWGLSSDFAPYCHAGTHASAIGGVTTSLVMHRVVPGEFPELRRQGEESSVIDFALSPTVFDDGTLAFIEDAIEDWGCTSLKFFMTYRNIAGAPPGDDWNELTDAMMVEALERLGRYTGTVARVHAENADIVNGSIARVRAAGRDGMSGWEEANPSLAETEAIQRAGLFVERAGVPVFFVHISGRDAIGAVERVRARWPSTYAETCPHYLFHNTESVPNVAKYSPPIRRSEDSEALWKALAEGVLNCVGSDSGATGQRDTKLGSVWDIQRGGPGGVGVLLPLVLSEGVNKGRLSLERAVEITSTNAARIFGLYPRKGTIQVGSDADLAIVDLDLERTVTPELFGSWSDYTLYDGSKIKGWPVITMVRGQIVASDGKVQVDPGYGRYVPLKASRRVEAFNRGGGKVSG